MAFVAETVGGATAGAIPPVAGYFRRVREICDRHGILLILDEVMCGMGRTGTLHACEQEGIAPDLMAIAKGLGGGFAPIGAVLVGGRCSRPSSAARALPARPYLSRPSAGLRRRRSPSSGSSGATTCSPTCARQGEHLRAGSRERFGNHHHVGDMRGRGLFQAIELVADRGTKEPFDPEAQAPRPHQAEAMARGLMVYPMGGTVDGRAGDHVLLAPPFIVERDGRRHRRAARRRRRRSDCGGLRTARPGGVPQAALARRLLPGGSWQAALARRPPALVIGGGWGLGSPAVNGMMTKV